MPAPRTRRPGSFRTPAGRAEESDADGRLRLEATFQDPRHAEWALWCLGTHAEALAPQWLRDSRRQSAAEIATRYGAPPGPATA
ncbi:WCX domain-containing protein [Streptomyces lavendulae]